MVFVPQDILCLDRHSPWQPNRVNVEDARPEDLAEPKAVFCCVQCLHPITDQEAYLELAGGHLHIFTNPGGFTYELALYAYADCIPCGHATMDYTWFAGYAWQLALCANCREHLGWRYRGAGKAAFYGLIRERLLEVAG